MPASLTNALRAAMQLAANRAILPRYQHLSAADITDKAADDVVTIADHESEEILAEALARIQPEATIVGEEATHANPALMDRLGDALCWIIDPLDGTNNFAKGKPPFGILVALSQGGETIGGWIYDVLTGRFCHAIKGGGAYIDDSRIHAQTTGQTPPVAAISLIFAEPARREQLRTHSAPHYTPVDIPRCAAEQYPRLVLGTNDVSIFERTLAWDHAAGVLFVNEAGGKAARLDGSAYRVDDRRRGLIGASSPALWDEMAGRLAQI